jgi:hypothetical protein
MPETVIETLIGVACILAYLGLVCGTARLARFLIDRRGGLHD